MRVPLGYSRLELRWCLDSSDREPLHVFSERSSALQFLLAFQSDPDVMLSLRRLLAEKDMQYAGRDLGDLEILEEIANRLESTRSRPARPEPAWRPKTSNDLRSDGFDAAAVLLDPQSRPLEYVAVGDAPTT